MNVGGQEITIGPNIVRRLGVLRDLIRVNDPSKPHEEGTSDEASSDTDEEEHGLPLFFDDRTGIVYIESCPHDFKMLLHFLRRGEASLEFIEQHMAYSEFLKLFKIYRINETEVKRCYYCMSVYDEVVNAYQPCLRHPGQPIMTFKCAPYWSCCNQPCLGLVDSYGRARSAHGCTNGQHEADDETLQDLLDGSYEKHVERMATMNILNDPNFVKSEAYQHCKLGLSALPHQCRRCPFRPNQKKAKEQARKCAKDARAALPPCQTAPTPEGVEFVPPCATDACPLGKACGEPSPSPCDGCPNNDGGGGCGSGGGCEPVEEEQCCGGSGDPLGGGLPSQAAPRKGAAACADGTPGCCQTEGDWSCGEEAKTLQGRTNPVVTPVVTVECGSDCLIKQENLLRTYHLLKNTGLTAQAQALLSTETTHALKCNPNCGGISAWKSMMREVQELGSVEDCILKSACKHSDCGDSRQCSNQCPVKEMASGLRTACGTNPSKFFGLAPPDQHVTQTFGTKTLDVTNLQQVDSVLNTWETIAEADGSLCLYDMMPATDEDAVRSCPERDQERMRARLRDQKENSATAQELEDKHGKASTYKTKLCPLNRLGRCKKTAEDCRFAHSHLDRRHTEDVFKTQLCAFWKRGKCRAGGLCRHAHGEDDLRRAVRNQAESENPPHMGNQQKPNTIISREGPKAVRNQGRAGTRDTRDDDSTPTPMSPKGGNNRGNNRKPIAHALPNDLNKSPQNVTAPRNGSRRNLSNSSYQENERNVVADTPAAAWTNQEPSAGYMEPSVYPSAYPSEPYAPQNGYFDPFAVKSTSFSHGVSNLDAGTDAWDYISEVPDSFDPYPQPRRRSSNASIAQRSFQDDPYQNSFEGDMFHFSDRKSVV